MIYARWKACQESRCDLAGVWNTVSASNFDSFQHLTVSHGGRLVDFVHQMTCVHQEAGQKKKMLHERPSEPRIGGGRTNE